APAHGEHVGVVVGPGDPGREQIVAEGGADPADFVGGDLLALPASPEHDAPFGPAGGDGAGDLGADGRGVGGPLGGRADGVDGVPVRLQDLFEVLLEAVARVIGADGDVHAHPPVADSGGPTPRADSAASLPADPPLAEGTTRGRPGSRRAGPGLLGCAVVMPASRDDGACVRSTARSRRSSAATRRSSPARPMASPWTGVFAWPRLP